MYHELICTDCAIYMANGKFPEDADHKRDQQIHFGCKKAREQLKYSSVGEEYGFSTQPCWTCESPLHGDRHYLNYIDSID